MNNHRTPIPPKELDSHDTHCCIDHGCKYGHPDCAIAKGLRRQTGLCENCGLETEGYYGEPEREYYEQKQYVHDLFYGTPTGNNARILELQQRNRDLSDIIVTAKLLSDKHLKTIRECYNESVAELTKIGGMDMQGFDIKEEFTFFWNDDPFSQWSRIGFTIDDQHYNCAEQWMMACKARHFDDEKTEKEIMQAKTPKEQKALGRKVKNFQKHEWERVAKDYVYQGNKAKFTQHPKHRATLLATKGTTLVEASPYDTIWGIGLKASDPDAKCRSTWKGSNWLGEVLTKLRDDFLKEQQP